MLIDQLDPDNPVNDAANHPQEGPSSHQLLSAAREVDADLSVLLEMLTTHAGYDRTLRVLSVPVLQGIIERHRAQCGLDIPF